MKNEGEDLVVIHDGFVQNETTALDGEDVAEKKIGMKKGEGCRGLPVAIWRHLDLITTKNRWTRSQRRVEQCPSTAGEREVDFSQEERGGGRNTL